MINTQNTNNKQEISRREGAREMQIQLGLSSSSNHVHGTPDHGQQLADHGRRLTDQLLEEEEEDSGYIHFLLERKAEVVQDLKNLGFSASEDRVVHKKMEGQVKHFEDWRDKSREKLNDALLQTVLKIGPIEVAYMYFVTYLRSGLEAIFQGSTKNVLIIVELIINIIVVYNCHKQIEYWLKLRAKANKLVMKVKNVRSNLVYVPMSDIDADAHADYTIDYACIDVARSRADINFFFNLMVFSLLLSIATTSFMGFVQLWYAWHELTVQW